MNVGQVCPTYKLAKDLPAAETVTIQSEGQSVRVVARCTSETPALKAVLDDASHLHACLLQQE